MPRAGHQHPSNWNKRAHISAASVHGYLTNQTLTEPITQPAGSHARQADTFRRGARVIGEAVFQAHASAPEDQARKFHPPGAIAQTNGFTRTVCLAVVVIG